MDALNLGSAVVVADDGDKSVVYAEYGHEEEALELEVSTVHRNGGRCKGDEQAVHDIVCRRAYAHHDYRGEAYLINAADDVAAGGEVSDAEGYFAVMLFVEVQTQSRADCLSYTGSNGSTGCAHGGQTAPAVYEKGIKHDVRDRADNLHPHGKLREA